MAGSTRACVLLVLALTLALAACTAGEAVAGGRTLLKLGETKAPSKPKDVSGKRFEKAAARTPAPSAAAGGDRRLLQADAVAGGRTLLKLGETKAPSKPKDVSGKRFEKAAARTPAPSAAAGGDRRLLQADAGLAADRSLLSASAVNARAPDTVKPNTPKQPSSKRFERAPAAPAPAAAADDAADGRRLLGVEPVAGGRTLLKLGETKAPSKPKDVSGKRFEKAAARTPAPSAAAGGDRRLFA